MTLRPRTIPAKPLKGLYMARPRGFHSLLATPSPTLQSLSGSLSSRNGTPLSAQFVQPIIWGDQDSFLHVNNVRFVRFFESARMAWAEQVAGQLGDEKRKWDLIRGRGVSFILGGIDVKYRRPVVYPDTLVIGSQVLQPVEQGADRFVLQSSAYSLKAWEEYQRKVNALAAKVQQDVDTADTSKGQPRIPGPVCTADQLCVSYDYDRLSKAPLPEDLRLLLANGSK